MSVTERPAGPTCLPSRRLAALRCALTGHRWSSSQSPAGAVVITCAGCRELVWASLVDQDRVVGPSAAPGETFMGPTLDARLAIDLVMAVVADDRATVGRLRRQVTARPGAAVDALAGLAALLSRSLNPGRPLRPLHIAGAYVEMSDAEHSFTTMEGSTTP